MLYNVCAYSPWHHIHTCTLIQYTHIHIVHYTHIHTRTQNTCNHPYRCISIEFSSPPPPPPSRTHKHRIWQSLVQTRAASALRERAALTEQLKHAQQTPKETHNVLIETRESDTRTAITHAYTHAQTDPMSRSGNSHTQTCAGHARTHTHTYTCAECAVLAAQLQEAKQALKETQIISKEPRNSQTETLNFRKETHDAPKKPDNGEGNVRNLPLSPAGTSQQVFLYIYVYVNVCIHMYMYVYVCIYIYTYVSRCMCIFVCMYVYIEILAARSLRVYIYVYMYVCIYIYIYAYGIFSIYVANTMQTEGFRTMLSQVGLTHCNTLQHTTTQCLIPRHTAIHPTRCNTLSRLHSSHSNWAECICTCGCGCGCVFMYTCMCICMVIYIGLC